MARPIEFNRTDVLDRALAAFWQSGHAACSMQVLVEATGLSRQSMYNVFGDKDGLFRAAVTHYRSKIESQCQPLEVPEAGLESLRAFILTSLNVQSTLGPGACFIVITAFSPQAQDPLIKPALKEGATRVRKAFAFVLGNAQTRGEIPRTLSPEDTAAHLYCVMNGLSALAQTGGTEPQMRATLDLTFHALTQHKDLPHDP